MFKKQKVFTNNSVFVKLFLTDITGNVSFLVMIHDILGVVEAYFNSQVVLVIKIIAYPVTILRNRYIPREYFIEHRVVSSSSIVNNKIIIIGYVIFKMNTAAAI